VVVKRRRKERGRELGRAGEAMGLLSFMHPV
jgi:hypothetical protein